MVVLFLALGREHHVPYFLGQDTPHDAHHEEAVPFPQTYHLDPGQVCRDYSAAADLLSSRDPNKDHHSFGRTLGYSRHLGCNYRGRNHRSIHGAAVVEVDVVLHSFAELIVVRHRHSSLGGHHNFDRMPWLEGYNCSANVIQENVYP